jgi:hypothetical protein
MDAERYGPWDPIIGGCGGMGAAFAPKLADRPATSRAYATPRRI